MVWVRYDDEFHHHDKVMEARDADPGSLALHLLGNTWTASSKTPGWIPAYVPRQLTGAKGKKWAQVLVDSRLWDAGELDGKSGWWVHDFEVYNPVDEATKRRRSESARKAANARWHPDETPEPDAEPHADRMPDAMQAASEPHAELMPSDAIARGRPVPVPSNSTTAVRSRTVPPGAVAQAVKAYVEACPEHPAESLQDQVARSARVLLGEGTDPAAVITAATNAGRAGYTDLARQIQIDATRASPEHGRPATNDLRVVAVADAITAVRTELAQLDPPAPAERRAIR